jgi:hypothetical protein
MFGHLPLDIGRAVGAKLGYQAGLGGPRLRIAGKNNQTLAVTPTVYAHRSISDLKTRFTELRVSYLQDDLITNDDTS